MLRNSAAALLIPFLLLPNFAFLAPLSFAATSSSLNGQPSGTSLSPGTVTSGSYLSDTPEMSRFYC